MITAFQAHSGAATIHAIRRRHVLAFRDHLSSAKGYAVPTVNKKVSFLSSLLKAALSAGWLDANPIGEGLILRGHSDEGQREPYSDAQLGRIFAHPIFARHQLLGNVKACGELQFWLPLIACTHGMISSEIIQLGPDTIRQHPLAPAIWCFEVTTAGGRSLKSHARRRWMPIRRELLDLGILALVEAARARGSATLWPAMDRHGGDLTRVSGYFSSFWARLSKRKLGIDEDGICLYSFRHAFQDRLARAGFGDQVKKALMGHAETGMTGRYGTKKAPREVDIVELDRAIQALDWPFLGDIGRRAGRAGRRAHLPA